MGNMLKGSFQSEKGDYEFEAGSLLEGGGLVKKREVKGVLILYNSLAVMFRKEKKVLKNKKGGENEP